jgi:membrane fusion protein, multidrug efflux system
MDGDQMTDMQADALRPEQKRRALDIDRTTSRPKTVRWFLIIALLLAMVLGGLYGFNRFREQAIATYFATNTPPPAQISAVEVRTESVPRFAPAIGSLAAVHQVTINPEIGGRVVKIFFEPGMTVKAGEPLVQLNDAPEQADLRNYQAQARWAAATLQRSTELAKSRFEARETVDQKESQLDQARAQITKTEALIAQKLIRAPFAGKLGVRQIELGQYLTPGAPIVTLTDLSTLYANFTLPGRQRPETKVGQQVEVRSDAFPGRVFDAKITTIEPQISPDTRTMQVQATMQNPDDALLPGMFVDAKVMLPPQPDMLVLPATAVEYTLYGDSVFVIREDGKDAKGEPILKAVRTPVKTGTRWGDSVAILDGLKPGERVVAAGQVKVQNGTQVKIGSPAPAPPSTPTLN